MCAVPSIAVFCSRSIERIPCTASNFLFTPFVALPVASIITGMSIHFTSHIRFISIHKLMYFSLLAAYFYVALLSAGIATSISMHVFSLLCLIIISGIINITTIDTATDYDRDDQRSRFTSVKFSTDSQGLYR